MSLFQGLVFPLFLHFISAALIERTLPKTPQRGAHGVILLYDVTKRASFEALSEIWLKEVSMYSTRPAVIKMIVGNKVDLSDREVSREEGMAFARQQSTLFVESSAKTAVGVRETFEELVRKILQTPELCTSGSGAANGSVRPGASAATADSYSDCSC
jgi:Ras-related protein Rab-18